MANTNTSFWKRGITLGEVIGITMGLLGTIGTAYLQVRIELREHSLRLTTVEQNDKDFITIYKEDRSKQDIQNIKVNDKLEQVLINLQNKKDRD